MTLHILLDSGPLGLLSKPVRGTAAPIANWAATCLAAGHELYVPEVIDYELRRELLRAGKVNSLRELDRLKSAFNFLPITSATMLLAADLWAASRQSGLATGDPKKLDVDVILAAQALTIGVAAEDLIVATSNAAHLSRFVRAENWSSIQP